MGWAALEGGKDRVIRLNLSVFRSNWVANGITALGMVMLLWPLASSVLGLLLRRSGKPAPA